MKRRLRKGITDTSSTASNRACFDGDKSGSDDANGNKVERHTAVLQQHVNEEQKGSPEIHAQCH